MEQAHSHFLSTTAMTTLSTTSRQRRLLWWWVISHVSIMGLAFWFGLEAGEQFFLKSSAFKDHDNDEDCRGQQQPQLPQKLRSDAAKPTIQSTEIRNSDLLSSHHTNSTPTPLIKLPEQVSGFIAGISRVSRQSFLATFDDGLPSEPDTPGNEEVLVLYGDKEALPRTFQSNLQSYLSASEAMAQCQYVRVVSVNPDRDDPACLAIQGYFSEPHYYLHKFLKDSRNGTFHPVGRFQTSLDQPKTGLLQPPPSRIVHAAHAILHSYLENYHYLIASLKEVIQTNVAAKTVVATVVDAKRVNLLRNFVCAGRHHQALPTNLLIFSLDPETHRIVTKELKLTSFFNPLLFSALNDVKSDSDNVLGEDAKVVIAQIFAAHMITDLKYNLLFHDVDIVPYKDYASHLRKDIANQYPQFELYMSYNFTTNELLAPWGANAGLWYAKSTLKTRYFFSLLIRRVALALHTQSLQETMSVVMSDVASHYGLMVKVLDQHGRDFPVSNHFHHDKNYMKDLMQGKTKPYLLHLNSNHPMDVKAQFLQQIGQWYVVDGVCVVGEPKPECHYKDKPSKIPCPGSPAMESGVPFW